MILFALPCDSWAFVSLISLSIEIIHIFFIGNYNRVDDFGLFNMQKLNRRLEEIGLIVRKVKSEESIGQGL